MADSEKPEIKPGAPARKAPTFAQAWESSYPAPTDKGRLYTALGAVALALFVVWCVPRIFGSATLKVMSISKMNLHDTSGSVEEIAQIMADARKRRLERSIAGTGAAPYMAANAVPGAAKASPIAAEQGTRRRAKAQRNASAGAVAPPPVVRDEFEDIDLASSSLAPKRVAASVASATTGQGVILNAVLADTVASSPPGARVRARLISRQRLGGTILSSGAMVHGSVQGAGNEETRVFITFDFIVDRNGKRYTLSGSAHDESGRAGIPGKKLLSEESAKSVLVAGGGESIRAGGQLMGGALGILGAGIGGAAEALSDKGKRLDNDEYVVIAEQNTPMRIYVNEAAADVRYKDAS